MRTDRENKTDRLYRAIGGIDDRYLQEALGAAPQKKKGKVLRLRTVVILVAALLSVVILGTVVVYQRTVRDTAGTLLEQSFPSEKKAEKYAGSFNLRGGNPLLLWKYAGSDQTYSKRITKTQLSELQDCQKDAARVGESSDETVRVWLCDADGNVTTPFLLDSQGNAVEGALFDYEPELVVTEATAAYLKGLFT